MLQKIRKSKLTKLLACFLAVNMTISLFDVRPVLALTGGPDQIEFNNFRPANSTEMVNLFTGDFSYNIPLLDIDGYPLNIFYDGNVGMNQEASWVGLGWTLNPGAIGREMRGLPDDFKGEELTETFNTTLESEPWGEKDGYGARASVGVSSIVSLAQSLANINNSNNGGYGGFSLSPTYGGSNTVEGNKGLFFNNYNGLGYTLDFTLGNNSSYGISLSYYYVNLFSVNVGLGFSGTFSFNSQKGISISPSISLQGNFSEANNIGTGPIYASNRSRVLSTSFNSRSGLKEFAISQASGNETILTTSHSTSYTTRITLGSPTYFPQLPFNTKITNHGNVLNIGIYSNLVLAELFMYKSFQWYYNTIELSDNINRKIKAYGYLYPKNDTETPGELEILDFNREKDGTFTETTPHLPITNYTYDFYNVMGQGLYSHYRPYRNDIGTVNDLHGEMLQDGLVKTSEFGGGLLSRYEAKGTITTKSRGFTDIWIDNNSALSRLRFQDKTTDYPKYEPFYFKKSGEKTVFNKSYYEDRDDLSSYGDEYPVSLVLSKGHYIGKVPTIASEQGNSFFDFILEYLPSGYLSILNPPTYENNLGVTTHNLHFLISMNSHSTKEKNIPPDNRKGLDSREKRNELFTFYTADEASKFGSVHTIQSYNTMYSNASNGSEITLPTSYNRYDSGTNPLRKSHHISEISVIRPDGARYIYGVPVYNTSRKDVLFNISGAFEKTDLSEFDQEANLVKYTPNIDNTYNSNDNGKDHFFKSTELPPYAHSYLISAVLSPDYIDLTGNGPSDDDIGNYVEFNYTRKYNDYKWRIPYEQNMGDYLEEMKTNDDDDKAAYIFGEKEIWYVHSIESKNYIAEFYLEPRDDGLGVANENGGTDTGKKLMKLKKIMLFAKEDRRKEWSDPSQTYKAVPLKTVCFEYADDSGNEYTLCKNVPNNTNTGTNNNNNGKLTLRKIYFTYGNSLKGRLSPYVFEYSSFNPDYNRMYLDRWGNYKPNTDPLYQDYPYAEQDKTFADQYAGAWKLNRIELPSGASITIEYEADDYSYVHDKLAANMFNVAGFSPVGSVYSASSCQLHTYDGDTPEEPNLRLFVQLNSPVVDAGSFADYYLKADENYKIVQTKKIMKYLYFSCFVDLTGDNIINDYEYVSGYAEIMGFGISSDPSIAYIDLKSVTLNDFDSNIPLLNDIMTLEVNPIAKQAWQITRRNNPLLIWKNCSTTDDMYQCFTQVMGMDISSLQPFGINYALLKKKYGVNVDLAKSWVRLNTPDRCKLGGGYRVKKIVMNDAWSGMSGGENSETGFIYNYKIQGTTESTGVAAYEPFIGNDENNCRQPVFFNVKHVLFPDDNFYQEKPYGESYYPAPIVGYREITVSPYIPAGVNLTKNAAGYSKYRFYTTKDFPVKVRTTDKQTLKTVLESESMLEQLLGIRNYYQYGVSQGYAIELNDMHGKLKAIESYSSKNEQISKVSYKYKSNGNRLDNHTAVILKDGTVELDGIVGQEIDMMSDMRSSDYGYNEKNYTQTKTITPINVIIYFIKKWFFHEEWNDFTDYSPKYEGFRSAVMTKVISKYGLLDEITVVNQGMTNTTKMEAYDAETGEVLLTSTKNEFDEPVYSFTYPAHLAYMGMEGAFFNIGSIFKVNSTSYSSEGLLTISNPMKYFTPGDILWAEEKDEDGETLQSYPLWVCRFESSNKILCITEDGSLASPVSVSPDFDYVKLTVIRAGSKNMQVLPIATLTCLSNPLSDLNFTTSPKILSANAIEYSDEWPVFKDGIQCGLSSGDQVNPFLIGVRGDWRPKKGYEYLTDREYDITDGQKRREQGVFTTFFKPFWKPNVTMDRAYWLSIEQWNSNSYDKWKFYGEITKYNPFTGGGMESLDILGNYYAVLYGYNINKQNLPVAVSDARLRQIAYDGFEDYGYNGGVSCAGETGHFNFFNVSPLLANVTGEQHHTGKYSLKINYLATLEKPLYYCESQETAYGSGFVLQPCDIIDGFSPDKGRYIVSAWVKIPHEIPSQNYDDAIQIYIETDNNTYPVSFTGPVIEDWQKIEGDFNIVNGDTKIKVRISFDNTFCPVYIDDIRIHPFTSSMNSYVYDPEKLRIMATLDENNFATFYEYDEEGIQVRSKIETPKGIITLNEARSGNPNLNAASE